MPSKLRRDAEIQFQWDTRNTNENRVVKSISDVADSLRQVQKEQGGVVKQFEAQAKSAKKVKGAIGEWQSPFAAIEKRLTGFERSILDIDNSVDRVNNSIQTFARPLENFSRNYTQAMGKADAASRSWLIATTKVETAQNRIGRVAAGAIAPTLEALAEVANQVADFAEQHPEVVQGIINVGAFTAVAATATQVAGQTAVGVKNMVEAAGLLSKALGIGGAGASAAASGATIASQGFLKGMAGTIASGGLALGLTLLGGIAAGFAGAELLREPINAMGKGLNDALQNATGGALGFEIQANSFGKVATIAASGAGWLTDKIGLTDNAQQRWAATVADLTGAIDSAAAASQAFSAGQLSLSEQIRNNPGFGQAVEQYRNYQRDLEDDTADHNRQLEMDESRHQRDLSREIQENQYDVARQKGDFYRREMESLQNHLYQISQARRDAQRNEAREDEERARNLGKEVQRLLEAEQREEEQYYQEREKEAERHGEAMLRREQDFQRQQRRNAEDHDERLFDLASQRDAIGIVREMRNFEKERRRTEEDHDRETAQTNAEYAKQLGEQAEAFAEQRAQRLADFERQRADEAEEFSYRRRKTREELEQRLRDGEEEFQRDRQRAKSEFDREQQTSAAEFSRRQQTAQQQYTLQKQDEELNYKYQRERRKLQFDRQIQDLADFAIFFETSSKTLYEKAAKEFEKYLEGLVKQSQGGKGYSAPRDQYGNVITGTYLPPAGGSKEGKSAGGYASPGVYALAETGRREYVLNAEATRKAEGILGGSLTQSGLLAALSGGGGGGGSMIINVTNILGSGQISQSEIIRLRDLSVNATLSTLAGVLPRLLN